MSQRSDAPQWGSGDLQSRYDRILDRRSIRWETERPLIRHLGGGGQGVVYLSVRRGAGDFTLPVALKLFSPALFRSVPAYQREMLRVAQVAATVARIQHDNLVDVHNFVAYEGVNLMEMEWIDGYNLEQLLKHDALQLVRSHVTDGRWESLNDGVVTAGVDQCRLKPAIAVGVIRECLEGLSALHRAGIVHSDLKPSNIMLKRTGSVKLIDIGSAYETRNAPLGQPCTPAYAAPEVLLGERGTFASDLASLGYILLELLTGVHPFAGLKYKQLVRAKRTIHQRLEAVLPDEEMDYAQTLIPLIRGLVDPDPEQRFATADAAALSDEGASGFLRQLVKGDVSSEYENDIRHWIAEIEADFFVQENPSPLGREELDLMSTQYLDPASPEIPNDFA